MIPINFISGILKLIVRPIVPREERAESLIAFHGATAIIGAAAAAASRAYYDDQDQQEEQLLLLPFLLKGALTHRMRPPHSPNP